MLPGAISALGIWSHPSRGAWIEMGLSIHVCGWVTSHPSRGAWIEIISKWADYVQWARTPHGVRGLKY